METLINALQGTPWWVYVVFAYLVMIGIKAMKPQMVSVNKMFIIPLIFIALSIYGLIVGFRGWPDLFFWAIALVAGFFVGGRLAPEKFRADRKKLLAYIPGSPVILILILAIFAVKYFFGYYSATHEVGDAMHVAQIIASGAVTGIFVGRTRAFLLQFSKAKHESLKKGGNPRKKSLL